jgi:hypothetical protein
MHKNLTGYFNREGLAPSHIILGIFDLMESASMLHTNFWRSYAQDKY